MPKISVDERVFNRYPTFRRGVVVATGVNNTGSDATLENYLAMACASVRQEQPDFEKDPQFQLWDEAHRRFGSNPRRYMPAHKALAKRVAKPGSSVRFISKAVAIMNATSLKMKLPVGGDDLSHAGSHLELRYANGEERFSSLGRPDVVEHPEIGEVIYVARDGEVMCRRWNWRNSHATALQQSTSGLVMNIDGIGPSCCEQVIRARDMVAELLEQHCGAQVATTLLSPSRNQVEVSGLAPMFAVDPSSSYCLQISEESVQ